MSSTDEDRELIPPCIERIRRRAWALSAVACRCFIEGFTDQIEAATLHSRILNWIDSLGLSSEFEPTELAALEADLGTLEQQTIVNGSWRSEGLAVLAWAMGGDKIPHHDVMVDPSETANSIFFLADDTLERATSLNFRRAEEIRAFGSRQLAIHWRIRDFSIRPRSMDFRQFSETAWYGSFPLTGIPLAENDLAIDGVPISKAPHNRFRECQSIAMERHLAINWLRGWSGIYSEVDTST